MQLDRAVAAGDVRCPLPVPGEGERHVGDLPRDPADDLPELLDAEAAYVLAARDRVLVRAAAGVHQLAADLGDAVLVQAANRELDAEPGIDPGRVDHQVPHAVGEAVDRDLGPDQQEAEGSPVLLGDLLAREGAERVAPVRRSGGDGTRHEQSADSVLVNRAAREPVPVQIAGEDEGGQVLLRGRSAAAKPVKRSLARGRCFLGGDLIAAVLRDGHVVSVSPMSHAQPAMQDASIAGSVNVCRQRSQSLLRAVSPSRVAAWTRGSARR